jgi:ubiquitin-protein ligase
MQNFEYCSDYEYSDDESTNIQDYEYHDYEREMAKMMAQYSENKVWIKQIFKWIENNEKQNKKYFVIWEKEQPLKCTILLFKNESENIGSFTLNVSEKEPYFPFSPPKIEWIYPDLNFIDSFSVKYIESLRRENWNICQDLDEIINKIHQYISQIKKETKKYDKQLVSYLYKISEISGIYPSTITSELPKLGVFYSNTINEKSSYKGIGYSQGNIESWDLEKWNEKKQNTYTVLKDLYQYLYQTRINENDLENIRYSSLIPYLSRIIKNSSIQEINKNSEDYIIIYKFGNWIYSNIGIFNLHTFLKEAANEIKYINTKIKENSDCDDLENMISEHEKQIISLSEIYETETKNDNSSVKIEYTDIMQPIQCELVECFSYHSFKKKEFLPLNQNNWFKRLFTEWKDLQKSLPLHNDGSVFIRWGAEGGEAHLFKILVFPSLSTPYGGGAYEFDMYIPPEYPNTHPTMKFVTTGGGTVRFNPNLYNCGKICLSLLGTWSGEKWNPKISNIYQICVSILGLIFVEDPYFNEPGYQNSQGTEKGNSQSEKYNDNIKIQNIRYGIINMIKTPPKEFEEVIKKHYEMNIEKIKKKISEWIEESKNPKILQDLLVTLNNLK